MEENTMKSKKIISMILALVLCLSLVFTGCTPAENNGGKETDAPSQGTQGNEETKAPTPKSDLNIAVVVFGSFGDNGFNDMSKAGLERAIEELGIRGQAFESGGYDITKIEPLLLDLCEDGEYDAILTMGAACREATENASAQYPDQKFVIYDAEASYADKDLPNIASVTFRQNEASFLGGVIAGYVTTSDMEHANADKTVGAVLLRDNATINDFLVGYIEGCHYVDKDIRILSAYNNSASDSAKAKELALNMANQGADIVFGVCSLATLGVVDGCKEKNSYVIGVDNDTAMQVKGSDPVAAALVVSSVLKNTDEAVYRTIAAMVNDPDAVKWGEVESVGFNENCVGLARNEYYEQLPQELKDLLEQIEEDIISGKITVSSAFGMTTEEITALRDEASK